MTEPSARARHAPRLAWAVLVLGAGLVLARAFLFDLRTLASDSLAPELERGDLLVVWRHGTPAPGDLVLHRLGDDPERYVKRVVAVGGERVELVDGDLLVDGQSLRQGPVTPQRYRWGCREEEAPAVVEERDGQRWTVVPGAVYAPPETVAEGHLWVLGDHRARSRDSRHWGAVSLDEVEGVVVAHLARGGDCASPGRPQPTLSE